MTDKQIKHEQSSVIIDNIDVSGCIYYKATGEYNTCGYYCEQNANCYYKQFKRSEAQCEGMFVSHTDLEKKYKAKEQECEKIKNWVKGMMFYTDCSNWFERFTTAFEDWKNDLISQLDQLEEENRSLKGELMQTNCYLDADKETIDQLKTENESLRKQLQFEFDETLLQYSNTIEDLQKQLSNTVMQKCPQCGEVYLNPVGCELHEENQQLKAENKTQKETIDGFLTILDKLGKSNIKLREILAEIKEIAEKAAKCLYTTESDDYTDGYRWLGSLILQKIRKCEVENERILSEE